MWILALTLAACLTPSCPTGQTYSPVFGQCIGIEEPWTPTPTTPTGGATPTGDTGPTGDTAAGR